MIALPVAKVSSDAACIGIAGAIHLSIQALPACEVYMATKMHAQLTTVLLHAMLMHAAGSGGGTGGSQ